MYEKRKTMNSWKSIKLSDVCYFSSDKIEVSNLSLDNYVSTENMLSNKSGICRAVNLPNTSLTVAFNFGDILLSNIRPYFKKIWLAKFNGGCSNDVLVFRANKNIDTKFLYYTLSDDRFFDYSTKTSKGTKMPRGDKVAILKYPVFLPPLEVQKKIAGVLGALDDKIELNNKINNNLEQQAQALFKSWFVDFEPFGGVMPDDWKKGRLKDILKLKKNTIKAGENNELPYLPIDIIPMHSLALTEFKPNNDAQSSLIAFDKDDILIGAMRVYFHRVIIAPCAGITRSTCFVLSPTDKNYLVYGLLLCNQKESIEFAQTTSKGSTMPYAVWEGGLGELEIIIPSNEVAVNFNNLLLPSIKKIQKSYFENSRLEALRDTLLPKLMSGEIDVSKVDINELNAADDLL